MGLEAAAAFEISSFLIADLALSAEAVTVLTPLIITGAEIGAAVGISYALSSRPHASASEGGINPGQVKETVKTEDSPVIRGVGRGRAGGVLAFANTKDPQIYRLSLHCKSMTAAETYLIGPSEVIVETDDKVSSYPWHSGVDYYANLQTKLGDGTETAWADLLTDFPHLWTSDHRVRGIAQTLARFGNPGIATNKYLQLYGGGIPTVQIEGRLEAVYDPRTTLTAWSENGVLNAFHVLRALYADLNDLSLYDTAFIAAQANAADALVTRHSGTTARARAWGFWSEETARGDTLQQMLNSIGAMIVPRAGAVVDGIQQVNLGVQLIDDAPSAELTIPQKHILDVALQSGPEGVERPNRCRVKFYSRERNYALTEIDLTGIDWAIIQDEIDAYGEKPYEADLAFCPDAGQAQRIARMLFAVARADSGVLTTNMYGLAAWGARFINIEFPDLGTLLCKIGVPRVQDKAGTVQIPFVIWPDLSGYDPTTDEAPAPDQLLDATVNDPLTRPDAMTQVVPITYPDASKEARVTIVLPGDATTAEVSYRTYTNGLPDQWRGMTLYFVGALRQAYVAADLGGRNCDFRMRTNNGVSSSSWSTLLNTTVAALNTAPAIPLLAVAPTVTVTAPSDIQVAYLQITGPDAPGTVNVRPEQVVTFSTASSAISGSTWTARAFASDGTGGPTATYTVP